MDKLTTMTTFAKVVRYSSFTAAAEDLGISRALVSRHIIDLEAHFGVRLLHRTTRSVTPTEAGIRYAELCNQVLSEIRAGEDTITALKTNIEGDVAILCPNWVGNFDVSQALVDFCQVNPDINIHLHIGEVSGTPHEFLRQGFDICIQPDAIKDSDIMVKRIGEVDYILVASPSYIDTHGEPQTTAELINYDCLTKLAETAWSFKNNERVSFKTPSRYASNSFLSLCTAAVGGLGMALVPRRVAVMDLRDGNLRQILIGAALEPRPLYAAFAPGGDVPRKVRVLIDFLSDWFKNRSLAPDDPGRVIQMTGERRLRVVQT